MFADTKIVTIFPVPVWAHTMQPDDVETVNRKVLDAVETLRPAPPASGPWRTARDLHTRPELITLRSFIGDAAKSVLEHLKVDHDGVEIDGMWAEVVPAGAESAAEWSNPAQVLSGVYTLKAPQSGDGVVFYDPKPQLNLDSAKAVEATPYTARRANLTVRPGTLLLFPSWLVFAVSQASGEQERINLCFDLGLAS